MKKSWLAGVMSAALIVSLLAGCSSNSSGAAETKDTSASSETTAETTGDTANTVGDSDTILIGVSASITGSAPTNGLRTQQWMRLMRPAAFLESSWSFMWRMTAVWQTQVSMRQI